MFQTFDDPTSPDQGPPRLAALRAQMARENLDAFLVPRADAHQGEYVAPADARLAWLTGFTGSAGFCIALAGEAGVFIDGRYSVQVKDQVDMAHFTPVPWPETKPGPWLMERLPPKHRVAYDPWLHTRSEIEALEDAGVTLVPSDNLVDRIWPDRPAPPQGRVEAMPLELTGKSATMKRTEIAATLKDAGHDAAVLTLPDSICWLLNMRGSDIPRNPVVHCFAIVHSDARVALFIDPAKIAHLGPDTAVDQHPPSAFADALKALGGTVRIDRASAPAAVSHLVGGTIAYAQDPCVLPKAVKNPTEIEGTRTAHLRDAHAMVEFLAWLDVQRPGLTEIEAVTHLEGLRAKTNALRDISFDTIAGSGPNAALPHYRCSETSNRAIKDGELLLVDSGGQYVDGTTDITRTVIFGAPSREQMECYTAVLQGMVAISMARFPRGLAGRDIDPLARAALWRMGLDYDHGTGHGVGVYLCVHEGPQRISRISEVPLEPGMILSNEPGYYREGHFGIRIENLIVVQEAAKLGDHRDQLDFETLTWVPFDRRLIAVDRLSPAERDWINTYHAHVAQVVEVEGKTKDWLEKATAPL